MKWFGFEKKKALVVGTRSPIDLTSYITVTFFCWFLQARVKIGLKNLVALGILEEGGPTLPARRKKIFDGKQF